MRTIRHPVGYTLPVLRDRLTQVVYDPDTDTTTIQPWDLNDPSVDHVQLVLTDESGTQQLSAQMTIEAGIQGDINYSWQLLDVQTEGRVTAVEEVHIAGGGVQVAPAFQVDFYDPLASPVGATSPLCEPWLVTSDLACAEASDIDLYAQAASELLYLASGSQFSGVCEESVRPCPGLCGCWQDSCAECQAPCNLVKLPCPITEILEVSIDGDILDPGEYRVVNDCYLQRWDGASWPSQNYALPPGNPGTWVVTLKHGTPPPLLGVLAARDAACYLAGLYNEWDCRLPAHIQSLTRQGINQVFDPNITAVLALPSVKSFLVDAGYGHAPPTVWSPDMPSDPLEVM